MRSSQWEQYTFADLIVAGILQIGDGYRAKNVELGGDGPIFLRAGHVTDSHIDFEGVDRFRAELAERVRPKMSKPGDVIVTTKGNSTGRVSYVTESMPPFVYSPHLSYWRSANPDRLDSGFLRYWSRGPDFIQQLESMKTSTDMAPYLSLADQKRLWVGMPTVKDQRVIARILGSLDDKIDLNRRMNETLEAIACAIFRSWFVDFAPVRAKLEGRPPHGMDAKTAGLFPDSFEESSVEQCPRGWAKRAIGEITEGLYDGPHATPPKAGEGPIFLGIGNILHNQIDLTQIRHISEDDWPRWTRRVMPRQGDIVFTYEATLGLFAMIPDWLRCCLGRRLALIRPKPIEETTHFLYHTFTSKPFQEFLVSRTVPGATVDRISLLEFPSYLVLLPPVNLIKVFETIVRPLWEKIHSNLQQNLSLAAFRDALLPKLLSGEIRVKNAESLVQ